MNKEGEAIITFLPVVNFHQSAKLLDKRRLWQQVREAHTVYKVLTGQTKGLLNHPAVRMWRGYTPCLMMYYNAFRNEALKRGIKIVKYPPLDFLGTMIAPTWLGYPPFHAAHRANLLRKDATFYGAYGWEEDISLPYIWPVDINGKLLQEVIDWANEELKDGF